MRIAFIYVRSKQKKEVTMYYPPFYAWSRPNYLLQGDPYNKTNIVDKKEHYSNVAKEKKQERLKSGLIFTALAGAIIAFGILAKKGKLNIKSGDTFTKSGKAAKAASKAEDAAMKNMAKESRKAQRLLNNRNLGKRIK